MEKNVFSWRFMTPLYIGSALKPIDGSMIAVALPDIAAAVRVSIGTTTILVSVRYLAIRSRSIRRLNPSRLARHPTC